MSMNWSAIHELIDVKESSGLYEAIHMNEYTPDQMSKLVRLTVKCPASAFPRKQKIFKMYHPMDYVTYTIHTEPGASMRQVLEKFCVDNNL